jgi:hypothetical protein
MDYIRKNLGPNKVTVSINSSKFDETLLDHELDIINPFDTMDNIIELFKPKNFNGKNLFYESESPKKLPNKMEDADDADSTDDVEEPVKKHAPVAKPVIPVPVATVVVPAAAPEIKHTVIKPNDTLLYLLYQLIDKFITLFSISETNMKIDQFKNELIKNLTNENSMYKKLELNKLCKLEELVVIIKDPKHTNRLPLITYISRLINKSIAVQKDNRVMYVRVGTEGEGGAFINYSTMTIEDLDSVGLEERVATFKSDYYLKNNYVDKIESALVKELREIAEDLEIPKFKSLLKNELKVAIKEKLKLI